MSRGKRLIYGDIATRIIARIESGDLAPGARIGTLRSLSAEFSVAKGTIDRAVGQLREGGWVNSFAGSGIYVTDPADRQDVTETDLAQKVEILTEMVQQLRDEVRQERGAAAAGRGEVDDRLGEFEALIIDLYGRAGLTPPGDAGDAGVLRAGSQQ